MNQIDNKECPNAWKFEKLRETQDSVIVLFCYLHYEIGFISLYLNLLSNLNWPLVSGCTSDVLESQWFPKVLTMLLYVRNYFMHDKIKYYIEHK